MSEVDVLNTKEKVVRRLLDDKCDSCEKNLAEDDHTCPYAEDIGDDSETLCNCCEECEGECARDI